MKKEVQRQKGLSIANLQGMIQSHQHEIGRREATIQRLHKQIRQKILQGTDSTGDPIVDLVYRLGRTPEQNKRLIEHLHELDTALRTHQGEVTVLEVYNPHSKYSSYHVGIVRSVKEACSLYERGDHAFLAIKCTTDDHLLVLHQSSLDVLNGRKSPCFFGTCSPFIVPKQPQIIHETASDGYFRFWIGNLQIAMLLRAFGKFQQERFDQLKGWILTTLEESNVDLFIDDPLTIALHRSDSIRTLEQTAPSA